MFNLALGKPALQSSTCASSRESNPAADAKAGNNGLISHLGGFHTEAEWGPWWQVDLQDVFRLHRIAIFNRRECARRLTWFSIVTSLDGASWTLAHTKRDGIPFGESDDEAYVAAMPADYVARFVRIRLDGFNYLHFNECQVFGEPVPFRRRAPLLDRQTNLVANAEHLLEGFHNIDGFDIAISLLSYSRTIALSLLSGDYEREERELVRSLLRPGDRVLEAGTAIGLVSMTAAAIVGGDGIVTFDANAAIAADARLNFSRNGLDGIQSFVGILRNRQTMGSPGETVPFYIDRDFWTSRLNASPDDPSLVGVVQVPSYCLESQIEQHRANVLICDIEGGEIELLMQADLTGIGLIVLETHPWSVGEEATAALIGRLTETGFAVESRSARTNVLVLRRQAGR